MTTNKNDLQTKAEKFNNEINGLTVFTIRKRKGDKELAKKLSDEAYEISVSLMDMAGIGTPEFKGWTIPFFYTEATDNLPLKNVDREFKLTKEMANDLTNKLKEALKEDNREKYSLLSPLYMDLEMRLNACLLEKRA